MLGDAADLTAAHARVFPGYPAIVAVAHVILRTPLAGTALAVDWASAAAAAGLSARLFRDVRVGLAVATLVPHYLMNSTMAMSEAPLLALTVAGLLLADRRPLVGGLVLGSAGLVRPMACFAVAGAVARRPRRAAVVAVAAAAVVVAGGVALHVWRGDALANVHGQAGYAYHGRLFDWPFRSLVTDADPAARVPRPHGVPVRPRGRRRRRLRDAVATAAGRRGRPVVAVAAVAVGQHGLRGLRRRHLGLRVRPPVPRAGVAAAGVGRPPVAAGRGPSGGRP